MQKLEKISNFVSKYLPIIVIIISIIALIVPQTFLWVTPQISPLLGIAMFGMGMTLKLQDFQEVLKNPKDVLVGVLAQFTIMPALAYFLAKIFSLPPELAVGVILVGTCPGGTASNVITYLAKGDVALSVSITMTTTTLAPIVTPFLTLLLAGKWIEVSFSAMMLSICQIVILPIVLGIVINSLFSATVEKFSKVLPLISILAILLIVGGVVSANAQKILEVGLIMTVVVILHNLLGYFFGFLIARAMKMNLPKTKTLSIEVGMQNAGLASSLAILHFGAVAAIPSAIFTICHNVSGSIMANVLSRKKS